MTKYKVTLANYSREDKYIEHEIDADVVYIDQDFIHFNNKTDEAVASIPNRVAMFSADSVLSIIALPAQAGE